MRNKRFSIGLISASSVLALVILVTGATALGQESLAYSFNGNGKDGIAPFAGLISDAEGNLYGTTVDGGTYDQGTVFELRPAKGGGWTEHILHSFDTNIHDGGYPYAGLIFDSAGDLYGTTVYGGTYNEGTVFKLTRGVGEAWSEKLLHSFRSDGKDGEQPFASLIFDSSGNLYGTTFVGGAYSRGTVFELLPASGGEWIEKVIYTFNKNGRDGINPYANLIFDASGNLYGTTGGQNGHYNFGTVFELVPTKVGGWSEKVLHIFKDDGTDGLYPHAVVSNSSGNLYGTTNYGGAHNGGVVFELTPSTSGAWTEKLLYSFGGSSADGSNPWAAVVLGASGDLYGTTQYGGSDGAGTVFNLAPVSGGDWVETILHSFENNSTDGWGPYCDLILGSDGNLYGTTFYGGSFSAGAVFWVAP